MRPVFWSFLAGLIAILAVSVLDYLLVPAGDTHLGPFIHVLLAVTYFLCLLLGTAVAKLCAVSLREVAARRVLPLCCSFLAILICNVGAFLVISRAILGYWVWEASIWWLAPSLVVGFVAASVFIYGYRIRTVQPCAAANPAGASQLQSTRPAGRIAELGSFDQKHGAVTLYLIDGKEAHGQDYVGTIDALTTDDLAY